MSRKLTSTRLVFCVSPGYLRRRGKPTRPDEVVDHTVFSCILRASGDNWTFKGREGSVTVRVTPRLRSNNGETRCAQALHDQGLVLQPSFMVGHHLQAGASVELPPQ